MILVLNSKTFSIDIVIDIEIIGTVIDKSTANDVSSIAATAIAETTYITD